MATHSASATQIVTSVRKAPPSPSKSVKTLAFVCNNSAGLELFRGTVLRRFIEAGFNVHILCPYDPTTGSLISSGARFTELKLDRNGQNPFAEISLVRQLFKAYRRISPDLIFHYTIKLNIYGTFAAKQLNIPSVSVVPGLGAFPDVPNKFVRSLLARGYAYAAQNADEIWFLNQHDFGFFEARSWLAGANARILPGEGIDTQHYQLIPLPLAEKKSILFIGRLLETKGARVYAEAARLAKQAGHDYNFILLGGLEETNPEGSKSAELASWIDEGIIQYGGLVKDVRPHLAAVDMVVVPTHFREGLNRVIMESMACGRPVITTPVPGAGELIEHDLTGYIVPIKDPRAVLAAITHHLALSLTDRELMGKRARQTIVRRYDVNEVVGHYFDMVWKLGSRR